MSGRRVVVTGELAEADEALDFLHRNGYSLVETRQQDGRFRYVGGKHGRTEKRPQQPDRPQWLTEEL